jgi:hypothetical protein
MNLHHFITCLYRSLLVAVLKSVITFESLDHPLPPDLLHCRCPIADGQFANPLSDI